MSIRYFLRLSLNLLSIWIWCIWLYILILLCILRMSLWNISRLLLLVCLILAVLRYMSRLLTLIRRFSLSLYWKISSVCYFLFSTLKSIFKLNFLNNLIQNSIHHFSLHRLLITWNRLLSIYLRLLLDLLLRNLLLVLLLLLYMSWLLLLVTLNHRLILFQR